MKNGYKRSIRKAIQHEHCTQSKKNLLGKALHRAADAISISSQAADVTPAEVRAIAKTYCGFPIVDNYRIPYAYFVNRQSPEFKAP